MIVVVNCNIFMINFQQLVERLHRFVYLFDWISIYDFRIDRGMENQKSLFKFLNTKTYDPGRRSSIWMFLVIRDFTPFYKYFVVFVLLKALAFC